MWARVEGWMKDEIAQGRPLDNWMVDKLAKPAIECCYSN